MPAPADLVHEASTTTGTGNFTLSEINGKRRFSSPFGTGGANVFDYFISSRSAVEWERGTGSMSDANTLVRDTVIASSNANAAVNFSAGLKDVTNDIPASKQVTTDTAQTLTNKTLTSPVLTTPQINDTSADHQYVFAVSELAADRTVTLPLLTGNDTFVFADHTQTLTGKTIDLTSNTLVGSVAEFNAALESADFYTTGGTDVALADGGTGASLADPNADRLMFWDDSAGAVAWATPGNGLEFSTTTLNTKNSVIRFYANSGSPHTWTKPTGLTRLRVWGVSPGGGGGGGVAGASQISACNGGNAGSYAYAEFLASELGATETVTCPAGGAGAANTADPPVAGTDGGTASFGALLTIPGGQSGNAMAVGQSVLTGTGNDSNSAITGADLSYLGAPSNRAVRFSSTTGFSTAGGSSPYGPGGAGGGPGTTGTSATGYGGGGGGGCSNSGTGRAGGNGSEALFIVEEIF